MQQWKKRARQILAWLLVFVLGLGGGMYLSHYMEENSSVNQKLNTIKKEINDRFLFGDAPESQEDWIYSGLLSSLNDPYAAYFTPEEFQAHQESNSGEYAGIGATVREYTKTGEKEITGVTAGGPADQAGVRKGEMILAVDGVSVLETDLETMVVKQIRGKVGESLVLTLQDPETGTERDVTVVRAKIHTESVGYRMLSGGTGYILVTEFIETTAADFKKAIDALQKKGAEGLVLDLRENSGGLLDSAILMADYILEDDLAENARRMGKTSIAYTEDKKENSESFFCGDGHSVDLPIAILINESTASASELLSAALSENGKAVLVGTGSYGKGIVQTLEELDDGSAVKLTSSEYYTPKGFALHKVGLTPDVEVERDAPISAYVSASQEVMEELSGDNQTMAAIEALDEIRSGQRKLQAAEGEDNQVVTPAAYLEQMKAQNCSGNHFSLTLPEVERILPGVAQQQGCRPYCWQDNWNYGGDVADEKAEYEHEVTVNLDQPQLEEGKNRYLTLSADPTGEERLHWFQLKEVTPEIAAAFVRSFMKELDEGTLQGLTDWLEKAAKSAMEQIYQGEGFFVTATQKNGLLTVTFNAK